MLVEDNLPAIHTRIGDGMFNSAKAAMIR